MSRTAWRIGLLLTAAVFAYYFYENSFKEDSSSKQNTSVPLEPEWERLSSCSPMQSLDGKQLAIFDKNHSVIFEYTGDDVKDVIKSGSWTFDEATNKYVVQIGDDQISYSLVQVQGSEVCLLAFGNSKSADLTQSLFSQTVNDLGDTAADDDR